MNNDLETRMQGLVDRQEIHDVLMRYCRGVDRADRDLLASTFHPDAVDDHGYFQVSGPRIADELLSRSKDHSAASMHFMGNETIDLRNDRAFTESYFLALLLVKDGDREATRIRCARYLDRFEKRGGRWAIARRVVVDEWDRIDEITDRIPGREMFHRGQRSRDDLVFRMPQEAG